MTYTVTRNHRPREGRQRIDTLSGIRSERDARDHFAEQRARAEEIIRNAPPGEGVSVFLWRITDPGRPPERLDYWGAERIPGSMDRPSWREDPQTARRRMAQAAADAGEPWGAAALRQMERER